MRTIGSIEKVLVGGIVVVIGAILAVAIKGAGDFDQAQREKQLASAGRSGSGKDVHAKGTPEKGGPEKGGRGAPIVGKPNGGPSKGETDRSSLGLGGGPALRNSTALGQTPIVGGGNEAPNGGDAGIGSPPPPVGTPKVTPEQPTAHDAGSGAGPVAGREERGNGPIDSSTGNPALDDLIRKLQQNGAATPPAEGDGRAKRGAAADIDDDAPVVVEDDGSKGPPAPAVVPTPVVDKNVAWTYEVRSGDSLERIARSLYGDGAEFQSILAANPALVDKNTIRVGEVLKLPRPPTQEQELAKRSDAPVVASAGKSTPDKVAAPVATPDAPKPAGFKRIGTAADHVVAKGDTLMSIALEHYGTKAAWKLIYDANVASIPDKDRIKIGVSLKLPSQ